MNPHRSSSVGMLSPATSGWAAGPSWGRKSSSSGNPAQIRPYGVTFSSQGISGLVSSDAGNAENARATDSLVDDDPVTKRKRAEAVLLLSKSPVTTRKLAQLAHLADGTEARTLVRDLNQTYDNRGRALRIELVAGGYRMLTRPSLAPWLARLGHLPPAVRLSSPMMETLAVVAYRQTVSRADVEAVRGVACGELLRQLMERDLIRITGRSEELGRPYLYGTTKRFLQLFGLSNVDALPPIRWDAFTEDSSVESSADSSVESTDDDSLFNDTTTSPKEPVVSTAVAPVMSETISSLSETDPPIQAAIVADDGSGAIADGANAVIEDEEDDLYGDNDDEDDIDDLDDDDDDDWAEDDDEEEDVDDDLDDDDDEEDDDWEEVDDDLDEEEDEEGDDLDDDEEWDDDDEEDDDEDWSEDDSEEDEDDEEED